MHFCQFEVFIDFFLFSFSVCHLFGHFSMSSAFPIFGWMDFGWRWRIAMGMFGGSSLHRRLLRKNRCMPCGFDFFFCGFSQEIEKNVILQGSMYVESHFIDRNSTQKYKIYPRIELRQSPQFSSLKVEARMRTEARFAIHFCLHAKRLITKQQQL